MSKKPAKHKPTREKVVSVEAEARHEQQQLRRLRNLHRSIRDLSRSLVRAVRTADGARLNAARELCEQTGWGVFDVAEFDHTVRAVETLRVTTKQQAERIAELEALNRNAATEINRVTGELHAERQSARETVRR